jgi:hypothetical protein
MNLLSCAEKNYALTITIIHRHDEPEGRGHPVSSKQHINSLKI